jgi:hypothetical protein
MEKAIRKADSPFRIGLTVHFHLVPWVRLVGYGDPLKDSNKTHVAFDHG